MIVRFIIMLIVFYLAYRVVKTLVKIGNANTDKGRRQLRTREDLVEDPCCHTYVPESDAYSVSIDGVPVYFCSKKCYRQFKADRKKQTQEEKRA